MGTFLQLNLDEKRIVESIYGRQISGVGYNPKGLESIKDLSAQEKSFFTGFLSPHFFIQTLYKVNGVISPINFNRVVYNMVSKSENLRANFCNVGKRTIKVIKGEVKPEIIFRNLSNVEKDELNDEFRKILEADMRRDFDLRYDPLIRFSVYKTDAEEFAVLVTMAQLIADSFDSEKFFAELFDLPSEINTQKTSDDLSPKAKEQIREYWAKILDHSPPPALLPFAKKFSSVYRQKAYSTKIPADILSDLRGFAQSNRTMLIAILQSAWGLMLQVTNKQRDCLFCQILSSGQSDKNSSLNIVPVRLTTENNLTIEQIIKQQIRQLVISQPYSCFDWEGLETLTGGRKKLFDHFLSFAEFQASELNYVETPAQKKGKIISRNSWDAQGMKLGVYFRYSEKNLSLTFLYDESNFLFGVSMLTRLYTLVLQQMLVDRNAKFSEFNANLSKRIRNLTETETFSFSQEDYKKNIRDFIHQLPILRGHHEGNIDYLLGSNAELVTRFEGDRLSGDLLNDKFIFVVSGKLAQSVDTGDGWYNPINVIDKNSFVNPTYLLEKRRLILSAEVLTEQAELLLIPRSTMTEVLRTNSGVAVSFMNYALEQMEKYQALWLQS
ncbi:MAG: hypothetical protein IKT98_05095 [Selenomonadaceae bacterium]|nr:hypothetical protein [Selenomonadaceae bacterium]